jgi:hypothetical protein
MKNLSYTESNQNMIISGNSAVRWELSEYTGSLELKLQGESVKRSQNDTKHETCYIRTRKKHIFLDISSANTNTFVPSLYQCVETRSIEVI